MTAFCQLWLFPLHILFEQDPFFHQLLARVIVLRKGTL